MRRAIVLACLVVPVLVIAATNGINTTQIKTAAPTTVSVSGIAAAEGTSLAVARADHAHSLTGTLPIGNGGTGVTSAADDTVLIGSGAAWVAQTLTDCDTSGSALTYDTTANTWGCNTSIAAATASTATSATSATTATTATTAEEGDSATSFFPSGTLEVAIGGTGNSTGDAPTLLTKTWAVPGTIGSTTPSTGAFTTLTASGVIASSLAVGTAPFTITSTTPVSNLAVIQGGLEGDAAAGLDERFAAPLTGFETSTFPPTTVTLTNTTALTWTTPGAGFPSDTAFIRQAAALTGQSAGANVVAHRGIGYAVNGNRGVDSTNSAMRLSAVFIRGGYFSVWYRAGTETCCDHALIYVDGGSVVDSHATDTGWVNFTSSLLAPGTHTMDFRYTKDGSVHSNGDMLMIDDVTIKDGGKAVLTTDVTGTLPVANGGTGLTTWGATGALATAGLSGTGAMVALADVATGSILVSGGTSTIPAWSASSTCTSSASTTCTITGQRSGCKPICSNVGTTSTSLTRATISSTTITCTFPTSGSANTCNCLCP